MHLCSYFPTCIWLLSTIYHLILNQRPLFSLPSVAPFLAKPLLLHPSSFAKSAWKDDGSAAFFRDHAPPRAGDCVVGGIGPGGEREAGGCCLRSGRKAGGLKRHSACDTRLLSVTHTRAHFVFLSQANFVLGAFLNPSASVTSYAKGRLVVRITGVLGGKR